MDTNKIVILVIVIAVLFAMVFFGYKMVFGGDKITFDFTQNKGGMAVGYTPVVDKPANA